MAHWGTDVGNPTKKFNLCGLLAVVGAIDATHVAIGKP